MHHPQSDENPQAAPSGVDSPENESAAQESGTPEPAQEASSFAELLSEFEASRQRQADGGQEARQGTVVAITGDSVFVDIGLKTEGVLNAAEFRDASGEITVKPGDALAVTIRGRDSEGYYTLSQARVERPKDWPGLEKAFAEHRVIGGVVTGVVKGGLSVDIGVRAFLPASRSGTKDPAEMEALVGQEIGCKIIELNVAQEDVVVDRRAALEEEQARARQSALEALREGDVVEGTVRTVTQFGAFLDIGGIEGLLHVTDMSWGRVGKPSSVVTPGQTIQVKVLKVDPAAQRVSLGLKQLSPDPWTLAAQTYKTGQRIRGRVSRTADFGAFVELEPGVEGLVHISEMSWSKRTPKPRDMVKSGEQVEVVVLGVNTAERRIALGLKQALGDPWDEVETKFPLGSVVEGPVANLANFGAFVDLGEGIEGMIHIGDIVREKRLKHPKEVLSVGQQVRAAVLEIDREKRRIRLGMKQLEPTTIDEYIAEHASGEVVTGRLVEIQGQEARVELGDGVQATCRVPAVEETPVAKEDSKADLSALTAMLSAKWKQGRAPSAARREPVRAGQIRSFRILSLDPRSKQIEVELAG